jgi:hypothetical protein
MLRKNLFFILTMLMVIILGGCLSKKEKNFLESDSEKKTAAKKIEFDLKKNGIDRIIFDKDSQFQYPQNGKFPDTDFVYLTYKVEFELFTYTGRAKFSIKNVDDTPSIDNLVDNGINGEESSSDFASSFAQSVCDELQKRFLKSDQFQEIMNKMKFNQKQLKEVYFSSNSSKENIDKILYFALKARSYKELGDSDLQDAIKLVSGSSFLNQTYVFHFGITAKSLAINEENFFTIMDQSDLPSGSYIFNFEDQSFELTKLTKEEENFIQNKKNIEQAQKILKTSLEKYSIQDNLKFDNEQQLRFIEKIDEGFAYDLVYLDYSLIFSTFRYDGTAVFHIKREDGNLQLDQLKINTLDAKDIDFEGTGTSNIPSFLDFFLQPINKEIMNRFYQSTQFTNFLNATGITPGDITEKDFFSGVLNDNLSEVIKIAKKVNSYTNYSSEDLINFLKVVNNNHEINPSNRFRLSIATNELTSNSDKLVELAEKNHFPKGAYTLVFADKEIVFEVR